MAWVAVEMVRPGPGLGLKRVRGEREERRAEIYGGELRDGEAQLELELVACCIPRSVRGQRGWDRGSTYFCGESTANTGYTGNTGRGRCRR